ncbi:MAG TPA: M4 family metallopeptidase, partial [Rhodothermales bacterium]
VLVTAASVAPAAAQKRLADPRPLTGLDKSRIRTFDSVQDYLQAAPKGSLLDRAVPVARSTVSSRALGPMLVGRKRASVQSTAPIQLLRIDRAENGTASWIGGRFQERIAGKSASATAERALAVLQDLRHEMKLQNPEEELVPMSLRTDDIGYAHARFEQTYEGIPVWGRDVYVHFDAAGEIYAVNGTYEPTPIGVQTRAELPARAAVDGVIERLRSEGRWAPLPAEVAEMYGVPQPTSRLVLYPTPGAGTQLAYEVTLHPNLVEWYTYIVDARDGSVLNKIARHCSLDHEAEAPVIQVGGMAASAAATKGVTGEFFDAQGVDLNGVNRTFRVYRHDDNVYYSTWDFPNFSAANSTLPDNPSGGGLTLTLNNSDLNENATLFHVTSNDNTWPDASGVSAHVNMRVAYDYFKDVHARNAIDGKDQSIISILHATEGGQAMDNAFWTGRFMVYGDGAQIMKPLAGGLDVAGHEMSHGVIEHSAGLIYQFQPGALNESFADVFGAMIDRDDLLMGEDIMKTELALRDLLNPDNPQLSQPQPAHMNQYLDLNVNQDNGGVHVNSGIPNRAAALLITAIGREKTEDIYYRALTNYLTRNSQFGDARKAVVQSAVDLFGAGSAEATAAGQAFDQVGVTDGTTGGGGGGGNVPPQTGGQSLITFMNGEGAIGYLNLTDPSNVTFSFFEDPNARARANLEFGDMSQLTAPRSGERIWFIDQDGFLAFVELASGEVSYFPTLNIQQEGDLWTASVSPDESYVALVSAYADDPTLYFYDGSEQLSAVELKPEGTQPGVFIETIQYPDVVSWSPNPESPRVAFDAYNEVALGTGNSASFWGMYEIDFGASKIYSLVPAQPQNVSVGNITYSNTSSELIAFNYIDENGTFDVYVGDFANGETFPLEIPTFNIGGQTVSDAQRPTFSPDDGTIAMTSPQFSLVLFYEQGGELSAIQLPESIYNPYWFLLGGTPGTDTEDDLELPSTVVLESNYPNPFNPTTTIRFSLPEASDVTLEVFDLTGRRVRSLVQQTLPPGAHEVTFDAAGLASGTYVARLSAAGVVAVRKMTLLR